MRQFLENFHCYLSTSDTTSYEKCKSLVLFLASQRLHNLSFHLRSILCAFCSVLPAAVTSFSDSQCCIRSHFRSVRQKILIEKYLFYSRSVKCVERIKFQRFKTAIDDIATHIDFSVPRQQVKNDNCSIFSYKGNAVVVSAGRK